MNAPEKIFTHAGPTSRTCIELARHDAIAIVNAEGLPVETGLYRVVWANRKSDAAFLLRFPDAGDAVAEADNASDGKKEKKKRRPNLKMPTHVSLATLEALIDRSGSLSIARTIWRRRLMH